MYIALAIASSGNMTTNGHPKNKDCHRIKLSSFYSFREQEGYKLPTGFKQVQYISFLRYTVLTTQHDKNTIMTRQNTYKISVDVVVVSCFCRVVVVFLSCCVVKKLYTLGMICTVSIHNFTDKNENLSIYLK